MDSFKNKLTVREVKAAMRSLPKGSDAYDVAYTAAMERIFAQGKESSEMAKRILSWILCARRPLRTLELLHALAVEVSDTEVDEENILDTKTLLTICAGLVTIDEKSDNVRFIHYTTQEYLQRNRTTWLPFADAEVARNCTAYLSLGELYTGRRSSDRATYLSHEEARDEYFSSKKDYYRRVETLALLNYAAMYWGSHVNALTEADFASEPGSEVKSEALDFLSSAKCLSSGSQALLMPGFDHFGSTKAPEGEEFSGSHLIARFGLTLLFRQWDSKEAQWDHHDFNGRTPLSWAAAEGQQIVSRLLLETGKVDANSKDEHGQTPLLWAAKEGHEEVVKLLLSIDMIEVDSADNWDQTPLYMAAWGDHEAIVKLLLDTDQVDIHAESKHKGSLLSMLIGEGSEAMFKLLLESGDSGKADVESKDNSGQSLLSLASEYGREAIVKLLLDTGKVDIDSKDEFGDTAFSLAAGEGHEAVIKMLLDTGKVDVNSKDSMGDIPLYWVVRNGKEAVIKLLLDTGKVDVDFKDSMGRTPLYWAVRNGKEAAVKLLLDTGKVDVDFKDSTGRTPLYWAVRNGKEAAVKLLIDTGKVDVDSSDTDGRTPLSYATEGGFEGIVKLLLDAGAVPVSPERPALSPRVPAENVPAT